MKRNARPSCDPGTHARFAQPKDIRTKEGLPHERGHGGKPLREGQKRKEDPCHYVLGPGSPHAWHVTSGNGSKRLAKRFLGLHLGSNGTHSVTFRRQIEHQRNGSINPIAFGSTPKRTSSVFPRFWSPAKNTGSLGFGPRC